MSNTVKSKVGRKKMDQDQKRQMVSAKIDPNIKGMWETMRKDKTFSIKSLGAMIDEAIEKEYSIYLKMKEAQ